MPRYFFDVRDGAASYHDPAGLSLASDDEVRVEAFALLTALVRDAVPVGDGHEIVVAARDDTGAVVYEARLSLRGRWWPGRRSSTSRSGGAA